MHYVPDKKILEKYADVMVNFALWNGKGIREGDIVCLRIPDSARAFVEPLQAAILKAGGHYILDYRYDNGRTESPTFYEHAGDSQIDFYPKDLILEKIKTCNHMLSVDSTNDKNLLSGVDPEKIMKRKKGMKFASDAMFEKVHAGKLSWTLCSYATESMAEEAGMSIEEYWEQIIKACYLDIDDPVARWREINEEQKEIRAWLDGLKIQSVRVEGEDADITIVIGDNRKWLGGEGNNIPSFEIFTSPDWRGTEGWIRFDQPLYRHGTVIEGIELKFEKGIIVKYSAKKNEQTLKSMIEIPGANRLGEFSLTDKRMSRITRTMGDTLYDENIGGKYGNTHVAIGMAYKDTYDGNVESVSKQQWEDMGYNDSAEHTDIISTTNRIVTATLKDGSEKVIYKDGMFTFGE